MAWKPRTMSSAAERAVTAPLWKPCAIWPVPAWLRVLNTQINRLSSPELESLLEVLTNAGVWAWRVQLTVPMGRAADRPEWLLQPYELLDLFPRLAALKERCRERDMTLFPGNNIGYFGPYEALLRGDIAPGGHWKGCQAGFNALGIEADGTLKGCPSLPTGPYAGGNLRRDSFRDLMKSAPRNCALFKRVPPMTCGASAEAAIMPRRVVAAAPGRVTFCLGARATTRYVTTAPCNCKSEACASASSRHAPRPACRSIMAVSI